MGIQDDLNAVDANGTLTPDQKRIVKNRIRSKSIWDHLRGMVGQTTTVDAALIGLTGSITIDFDQETAALFGHQSPLIIHPSGDLVLYVVIRHDGVVKYPTPERPLPLFINTAPFRDRNGQENPLEAGLTILAGLVS